MGFKRDIELGKLGEQKVRELFTKIGFKCEKSTDKSHDLNIFYENSLLKIEVKYDIKAVTTGNIAIEFYNPKKCVPTGISISQADYWCYVIGEKCWIVKTKELLDFCESNKSTSKVKIKNFVGDGNASIYLFKLDYVLGSLFIDMSSLYMKDFFNV